MIQNINDRYGAQTVRNGDGQGKQFPPRLSPRMSGKSVDPRARKQSLINVPNKTSTGFANIVNSFINKKASVPANNMS